jgi:hypothetical protein
MAFMFALVTPSSAFSLARSILGRLITTSSMMMESTTINSGRLNPRVGCEK